MKIVGMLRVRNEGRWIGRVIEAIRPVCDRIMVFDDHSDDETVGICESLGCYVFHSPFEGIHEARDKNYILELTEATRPDWIIAIDGDEVLTQSGELVKAMHETRSECLSLPVCYLWDSEDLMRVDGVYGNFRRESAFRPNGSRFHVAYGANFHCGNVPPAIRERSRGFAESPLLHFGYLHREDRIRKYEWYNRTDHGNQVEDCYRHMVIGDVFPAESEFKHAGPLKLDTLIRGG